jgi:starch synthase (maltosyl-transferring)
MYRLAKLGFSQSYTYFTWRHSKQEFIDYLTELTSTPPREFFRPHFFVNTPDINPHFLQQSGRAGHLIRAALAATLSGLWGVYSGFELCEAQAVTGKEEYLDSEKYEIRAWDWNRPGNIVREITQLNRIRKANPALHSHLNLRFHESSSEHILVFSKSTRCEGSGENSENRYGDNVLLVAINLDPYAAHDASFDVPLWRFGLPDHAALEVEDLMSESRFAWHGRQQHVHLDPQQQLPFAIWRVRPA